MDSFSLKLLNCDVKGELDKRWSIKYGYVVSKQNKI